MTVLADAARTCRCGCGGTPTVGKRFLHGHHQRDRKLTPGATFRNASIVRFLEYRVRVGLKPRAWYLVKCACGAEYEADLIHIRRRSGPKCSTCVAASRKRAKVGDRFDMLTVIAFEGSGRLRRAVCQCDCGGPLKRLRPNSLPYQRTNNCGCIVSTYGGFGELSLTKFSRVRRGAAERGIPFDLTIEFLWSLYQKQGGRCALTGVPIALSRHAAVRDVASVDRIDSSGAYEPGNVQWVHKQVNAMKMALTEERFIEICCQVADQFRRTRVRAA